MFEFLTMTHIIGILIVIASIPLSKIIFFVFKQVFLHISSRTKTTLDDILLSYVEGPVEVAMVIIGIFIAINYVNLFSENSALVGSIFGSVGVLIGAWFFTSLVNGIVKWYNDKQEFTNTQKTVYFSIRNILFIIMMIIALLLILRMFNVEITPLVASLGIGGLAVALALQSTLSNYFAGFYIAADGSIKIGDYIEADGVKGYIQKIGWRSTTIKTTTDNLVVVPNSKLSDSIMTNLSGPTEEVTFLVPCGVAYGSDLDKVEKITIETAKIVLQTKEGGAKNFEPFIRYNKFGDSNIEFSIVLKVEKFANQSPVMHEFIKELHKAYVKNGIEISYPVTKVFMNK